MKRLATVLAVVSLMLCSTAFAQTESTGTRKTTRFDFNEQEIEGSGAKPSVSTVTTRNRAQFENLITVRENFDRELEQSVNEL